MKIPRAMINLVNFIIESGISLACLSAIYVLFLRKETFFRMNRWFLLGSIAFSVILPFLKLRVYEPQSNMLPEITVTPYKNLLEVVTVYGHDFTGNVENTIVSVKLLLILYFAGLAIFLTRFVFRLVRISSFVRHNEVRQVDGIKLVYIDRDFSPFSFLNYVFVSRNTIQAEGYERMMAHEAEHVKQGHSLDVIILEILTVFQWFNPFMWLLRRAIRENHEFLADRAVIKSGVNPLYYKYLLVSQVVGFQLEIANNFNSSLIKNRIKMLTKIKSSKYGQLKLLLGLIVVFGLVTAFALEEKTTKKEKEKNLVLSLDNQIFKNTEDLNFITGVMKSKLSVADKKAKLEEKYILNYQYGVYGLTYKPEPEKGIYFLDGKEVTYEEVKNMTGQHFTLSTLDSKEFDKYSKALYDKYGKRVDKGVQFYYDKIDMRKMMPKLFFEQKEREYSIEDMLNEFYFTGNQEVILKKNQVVVEANGKKFLITGENTSMDDVITLLKNARFSYKITGDKVLEVEYLKEQEAVNVNKPVQKPSSEEKIYFIVEEMPEYPGGDAALKKYINESVIYPVEAQNKQIQGKVYVTFIIDTDGSVTDAKIARGVNRLLDDEAIRVVNSLPKWKPGKQKGKFVKVSFTVPINFVLR